MHIRLSVCKNLVNTYNVHRNNDDVDVDVDDDDNDDDDTDAGADVNARGEGYTGNHQYIFTSPFTHYGHYHYY